MFKVLANAWKVTDIRKKLLYVLLVLLIYRIGTHVPLPGIDAAALAQYRHGGSQGAMSLFSMIAGGGYGSIFAMGIAPYITSSIIMQLLTVAIPKLEQIQKEGEEGRKRINQYSRVLAVALSFLQGAGTVWGYYHVAASGGGSVSLFSHATWLTGITATFTMVAGTIFIMWLGELLTGKGIGNGSSFIIFANILSNLPAGAANLWLMITSGNIVTGFLIVLAIVVLLIVLIGFVIFVQGGERRIPVQYSRKMVGRQMYGNTPTQFIPIKVNIAGVMSIIFAISLIQFPQTIAQFIQNNTILNAVVAALKLTNPIGIVLYVILIFMFTFFYTSFSINTPEMAENMKKNGGFIPGIRPGKPTAEYVQKTVDRLSWIGAVFYALIALAPIAFSVFSGNTSLSFGGTTLLILTGVCLEFIKQLESQLLMRHYKGFLG